MEHRLFIIFAAYILDLIIGDPPWRWHPSRLLGRLIERLERRLNTAGRDKRRAGVILVISVVGITVICVGALVRFAMLIHPVFYVCLSALFVYFSISVKDLGEETSKVHVALVNKDIRQARRNLAMIVGRDTDSLREPEVIRAAVETVAESTMDGIVAPLFYAFLGGPVSAWAYKAVNTLDSMVGCRNERFMDFGRASAKLDGWVNLIPAKVTGILIFIAGFGVWGRSPRGHPCFKKYFGGKGVPLGNVPCYRWAARYILKGPRYNSEAAEAAMAYVLGVRLGGLNFYNAAPVRTPFIGDTMRPPEISHIKESIRIAYISSALCVGTGFLLLRGIR